MPAKKGNPKQKQLRGQSPSSGRHSALGAGVKRRPAAAPKKRSGSPVIEVTPTRHRSAPASTPDKVTSDVLLSSVMPAFEEKLHAALSEKILALLSSSTASTGKDSLAQKKGLRETTSAEQRAAAAEAALRAMDDQELDSQRKASEAELRAIAAEERAARLEGVVSVLERQAAHTAEAQNNVQEAEQRAARAEGAVAELRQVHGGFMSWVMSVAGALEESSARQPPLHDVISRAKAELEFGEAEAERASGAVTPRASSSEHGKESRRGSEKPPVLKSLLDESCEGVGACADEPPRLMPLPPGWQHLQSSRTCRDFFWNPTLKQSQWERPTP